MSIKVLLLVVIILAYQCCIGAWKFWKRSPATDADIGPDGLTYQQRKKVLNAHNRWRNGLKWRDRNRENFSGYPVGMNKLEWIEQLALTAKQVASACMKSHLPDRGTLFAQVEEEKGAVGENLAFASGFQGVNMRVEGIVLKWYREIKQYSWRQHTCSPSWACLHLTQMLWADTKYIGCAQEKCVSTWKKKGKTRIWTNFVCHYNIAGNWWGETPFDTIQTYDPHRMCPEEGTRLDDEYENLCVEK